MGPRDKLRVFKCKHGHERTPENTAYRVNGQGKIVRSCRVCDREWQSEHYDRRRRPCGKCGGIKDVRGPGTRLCSACRPPVYIAPVRECPHCGSEFIPPPNNRRKTYCTKACGQAHRKELHAAGNQV